MRVTLLYILLSFSIQAQNGVLILGNVGSFCFTSDSAFTVSDTLPLEIDKYSTIMLFSSSRSNLEKGDIDQLLSYINKGGGLYLGAENKPLQAESNQITSRLYNKVSYGDFDADTAECAQDGNLGLKSLEEIPAGNSIVAFPLDHRLTVEAWVEDEPLILSGEIGTGKIVIDGGYSRFYCKNSTDQSEILLEQIINFLNSEGGN